MAVTQVLETWEGRGGSVDDKAERRYTRTFIVRTSSTLDGPLTVMFATGLPRIYSIYQDANGTPDTGAWCSKVDPRQRSEDPNTWDVTCEFTSGSPNGTAQDRPDQNQENPLARPTIIKLHFEQYQKVLTKDLSPTPVLICSSAGETPDPPIEADDSRPVITMDRNEATIDLTFLSGFKDAMNSAAWFGFDIHTVKCSNITAEQVYEKSLLYWHVAYEFHIRPETWDISLLDAGFHELDGSGAQRVILDSRGQPLSSPALLDGHGHKLGAGLAPVYRPFRTCREVDFGALNLP